MCLGLWRVGLRFSKWIAICHVTRGRGRILKNVRQLALDANTGQKRIFLTGLRVRQKVQRAGGRQAEQLLGKKKPVEKVLKTISIWLLAAANMRVVLVLDLLAVAEVWAMGTGGSEASGLAGREKPCE